MSNAMDLATLEWCTVPELSRRWGVCEQTVRNVLFVPRDEDEDTPKGRLRAMRIGVQFRVHISEVERHEAPCQRTRTADAMKQVKVDRNRKRYGAATAKDYFPDLK
jgi:hypothetical protein